MLPHPSLAQVKIIERHKVKSFHLVADFSMRSVHESFTVQVVPWVCAAVAALSRSQADVLQQLARIARSKAIRQNGTRRSQRKTDWLAWLKGDTARGPGTSSALTKRAFLFVKSAAGWAKSPIAADSINDEVPDEVDASREPSTARRWTLLRAAEDASTCLPLCDQAAVEREADQWAALWAEHS